MLTVGCSLAGFTARHVYTFLLPCSIVFIDEIDKIVGGGGRQVGSSVSSEGVQRDLLPIIEGTQKLRVLSAHYPTAWGAVMPS